MGRGRAKAKQTKVARELKYRSIDTDFSSLEAELRSSTGSGDIPSAYADYADLADKYHEDDVDDDYDGERRVSFDDETDDADEADDER